MSQPCKSKVERIWQSRFMRFVAVSLLFYMAAHPLLPQHSCHHETEFSDEVSSANLQQNDIKYDFDLAEGNFIAEQESNDEHSDSQNHECDCFCQCNHILPMTGYVSLDSPIIKNSLPVSKTELLPNPSVPNLYHPPRFV